MRIKFFLSIAAIIIALNSFAQPSAVNFSLINCTGDTTTLYPILEQGNVVILMYEHECSSCLTVAIRIRNVINTYYSTNQNVQIMYLDNGGNNCATTANWISNNNLIPGTSFKYSNDYNSPYGYGMPVIAIAGGSQHHVYLTTTDVPSATETAIHNAIETALQEIANSVPMNTISSDSFEVFPNPVKNDIIIEYSSSGKQKISFELFDMKGKVVQIYDQMVIPYGKNQINLPLDKVQNGIYILKASGSHGVIKKQIVVEN